MSPFNPCGPVAPVAPVAPAAPVAPVSPFNPCGPTSPRGIVKLNNGAVGVPVFVIETDVPGFPVETVPSVIVDDPPPEDNPETAASIAVFLFVISVDIAVFIAVFLLDTSNAILLSV